MDKLRHFLEQKFNLSEEQWHAFSTLLVREEYSRQAFILKKGEIEKKLSFVEEGIVRFFIPGLDSDLTFAFIFSNEFVCAYDSFLTQQPSKYSAETLCPAVLWTISYENLQQLYRNIPESNIWGRLFTEEIYLKKAARELSLLSQSPEERYSELFTLRPNLFKNIPLKYIASYIGITPQALSRIRKRIS